MTKIQRGDVIRILARRCKLTKTEATGVVNELFGRMRTDGKVTEAGLLQEAVALGHEVTIAGFGTLERRTRAARSYQANVRLEGFEGEKIHRPKRHIAYFTPAPAFRDYVRQMGQLEDEQEGEATE